MPDKPAVVRIGQYEFKKAEGKKENETKKVELSKFLPEHVCGHCGKTFILNYGMKLQDYVYQVRFTKNSKYISKIFCCWSCMAKWRRENEVCKTKL